MAARSGAATCTTGERGFPYRSGQDPHGQVRRAAEPYEAARLLEIDAGIGGEHEGVQIRVADLDKLGEPPEVDPQLLVEYGGMYLNVTHTAVTPERRESYGTVVRRARCGDALSRLTSS